MAKDVGRKVRMKYQYALRDNKGISNTANEENSIVCLVKSSTT